MKRLLLIGAALSLTTVAAVAADPRVDQAVRAFRSVGYDQSRLKTYCEMSDVVEKQGDKDDDASEAALDPYLDRLGPDFEQAWETNGDIDENSADGKRLSAALDELDNKCDSDDSAADDEDDGPDDGADAADDAADAADTADTVIDILGGH